MLNFIDFTLEIPAYGCGREFWTESALECYQRGCNCQDCPIPHPTDKCYMKSCVLALVRDYGNPDEIIRKKQQKAEIDRIRNEAIFEGVREGKSQKQIAQELNINLYTLKKYMQRAGINLKYLKMYQIGVKECLN